MGIVEIKLTNEMHDIDLTSNEMDFSKPICSSTKGRRNPYTVCFKEYSADQVHEAQVIATSKEDAYRAFQDATGWKMYSAWVQSVTYQNGKCKYFNAFEGMPY